MITRYLTSVSATFSAFSPRSGKTARSFLALLPPNARSSGMKIDIKMLPQAQASQPGVLKLSFKDGKQMDLDIETLKIRDIQREVDRHSRALTRQEELTG
ncbi:39S ribosomal protein L53/MRP-L53 [Elsinoe fawcettii]|nr:39S ribosomal protein L53/MRP-L53 [Elsinoe fawcettii]